MFSYLLSILKKETMTPKQLEEVSSLTVVELTCDLPLTNSFCDTFEKMISLTSLKEMELWNFRVSAETLELNKRLIQLLSSIKTLISLKIRINCQLEDQEHLFDPLAELKNLQELILILRGDIPRDEWPKPASRLKRLPDFVNKLSGLRELYISMQEPVPLAEDSFVSLQQLQKFTMYISGPPAPATVRTLMQNLFLLPALQDCEVSAYHHLRHGDKSWGNPIDLSETKNEKINLPYLRRIQFYNLDLRQLPAEITRCENLEVLNIRNNYISIFPGYLPNVKHLYLDLNRKINIKQVFECLNPQSLQTLDMKSCNITQLPDWLQNVEELNAEYNNISTFPGYLAKIKKLTLNHNPMLDLDQVLTCLNPDSLQELNAGNCNLSEISVRIGQFRKLENLYLSHNPLHDLPAEIALLQNIANIRTTMNKSKIKFGQPVSDFISYLRKHSFSEEDKKRAYALFFLKEDYLKDISALELLFFLTLKKPTLVQNTLFQLEKKIADSIRATQDPSSLCICLFGSVEGMSTKELKEKCKKYNIQLESTLTEKATHILIGKGITEEQVQQVLQSKLPLVTSGQLRAYLEKLEKPFLKESDEMTLANLNRLLISADTTNLQLALEMINQGGLPDSVLYTLVLVVLQKELDSKIKKKAMTVLEKCAPVEITALIKRIRMKTDYLKIIQLLWKSPEIDKTLMARIILQFYFWESYSICSKEHQQIIQSEKISKYCLYYLLTTSVEDADFAVRSQTTRHGILFWSWLPLDKLTSSKASLDKIEALKIHISDFAKKTNPLKSFTGLKTLYLAEKNDELQEQAEPNLEKLQRDLPQLQIFFN
ncbi:hypothetical protein QNI19_08445 [Cytophagaceae bacterium DM2B3-1]|uniref:Leucine-rich repeat domain-containing protein n=1 Tax=Xanthocytophaga flava TaxID=3048013 RepID=A0ABT7CGT5_9BACT|nr:hypothetical protein [Xanthocytophaga flavus]MDJ1492958.1 hypothetical protein [Xanthocytophaga flavus]